MSLRVGARLKEEEKDGEEKGRTNMHVGSHCLFEKCL